MFSQDVIRSWLDFTNLLLTLPELPTDPLPASSQFSQIFNDYLLSKTPGTGFFIFSKTRSNFPTWFSLDVKTSFIISPGRLFTVRSAYSSVSKFDAASLVQNSWVSATDPCYAEQKKYMPKYIYRALFCFTLFRPSSKRTLQCSRRSGSPLVLYEP